MTTQTVLTVTELTQAIKIQLEMGFRSIYLQGEVSNCKLQSSGHLYFSLKDANAQIAAVMFRGDTSNLSRLPKEGDHVQVLGSLNVYPPAGRYQIVVRELSFIGLGELLLKLEQLKVKLQQKGWFNADHKKPLPKYPKTIGVVTSPTGAAIQDMLNILTRRFSGFHLILNPVKVQGEGAAQEIAQAIEQFNRYKLADVLIVGRGGGSIEDLWAFNEEIVAQAIFNSQIPIISAVGHETDTTIADFVADVRAPTPSAAAEIVIAEKTAHLKQLADAHKRIYQHVSHLHKQHRQKLLGFLKHPLFANPYALLGFWMQKNDDYKHKIDRSIHQKIQTWRIKIGACQKQIETLKPTTQILHFKQKLAFQEKRLNELVKSNIEKRKVRLENLKSMLHAVNPRNLLSKGYTILFAEKTSSVITSIKQLQQDQKIDILLADGKAVATINQTITQ